MHVRRTESPAVLVTLLVAAPLSAQVAGAPPCPAGNPPTRAKELLGKTLFWDEQLSATNTTACGTCHRTEAGFSDPRTRAGGPGVRFPGRDMLFATPDDVLGSPGVVRNLPNGEYEKDELFGLRPQVTKRKAPSIVDSAYSPLLLTTGDAGSPFVSPTSGVVVLATDAALESQAVQPIVHPTEMGHTGREWSAVTSKLVHARPLALASGLDAELAGFVANRGYPRLFAQAFGTPEITAERIAMAIASYERTLVSGEAPIDRFLAGDASALTPIERRGYDVFTDAANACTACHPAPLYTDFQFHYLGIRPIAESRGRFYVTLDPSDLGKFRTPSLRNVELRAPYFHHGGAQTLDDVVGLFDRGGDYNGATRSPLMHPLGLSASDRAALVAFLARPLTDPRLAAGAAPFDRPRLASEGGHLPRRFGAPTRGSGGFAPRAIAVEPPMLGADHVTVALDAGYGGANAVLVLDPDASQGGVPFLGATSWLALGPSRVVIPVGALHGSGAGEGWTSYALKLRALGGLGGTRLHGQWFVEDPGLGGNASASEAFRFDLF